MHVTVQAVLATFEKNVASVNRLLDFDRFIIEFSIEGLRTLAQKLRDEQKLHNASRLIENRVLALESVQRNDSLRPQYAVIFNQCVVLLVSYFGSAVQDLFRAGVSSALNLGVAVPVAKEEVKVAWESFTQAAFAPGETFAELLVAQKDISFQDMQSVARAFATHLNVQIERSSDVNDIVLGQAARHVIVHGVGVADAKMIRQISSAQPRTLKVRVSAGEHIQFVPDEIRELSASMTRYLDAVASKIDRFFKADTTDLPKAVDRD